MLDFLNTWGTSTILFLQSFRSPILDGLAMAVSYLGVEEFFLIFLPFIFWCVDKRLGIRLGILFMLGDYLNGTLKVLFHTPRPSDPRVAVLWSETSPAFPSGHAQNAASVWGYLAAEVRNPLLWTAAVLVPVLASLSRVYLGVHYPHDVLGGLLIGVAWAAVFSGVVAIQRQLLVPALIRWAVACLLPVALFALTPRDEVARDMGTLLGMGVGAVVEFEHVRFNVRASAGPQVAKLLLGLTGLAILWAGLRLVLPPDSIFRFGRYALIGIWVTLLAPWLFVRLGLSTVDPEPMQAVTGGRPVFSGRGSSLNL